MTKLSLTQLDYDKMNKYINENPNSFLFGFGPKAETYMRYYNSETIEKIAWGKYYKKEGNIKDEDIHYEFTRYIISLAIYHAYIEKYIDKIFFDKEKLNPFLTNFFEYDDKKNALILKYKPESHIESDMMGLPKEQGEPGELDDPIEKGSQMISGPQVSYGQPVFGQQGGKNDVINNMLNELANQITNIQNYINNKKHQKGGGDTYLIDLVKPPSDCGTIWFSPTESLLKDESAEFWCSIAIYRIYIEAKNMMIRGDNKIYIGTKTFNIDLKMLSDEINKPFSAQYHALGKRILQEAGPEKIVSLATGAMFWRNDKGELMTYYDGKQIVVEADGSDPLGKKLTKRDQCFTTGFEPGTKCHEFIYECLLSNNKNDINKCIEKMKISKSIGELKDYDKFIKDPRHPSTFGLMLRKLNFDTYEEYSQELGKKIVKYEDVYSWMRKQGIDLKMHETVQEYLNNVVRFVNNNPAILNKNIPNESKLEETNWLNKIIPMRYVITDQKKKQKSHWEKLLESLKIKPYVSSFLPSKMLPYPFAKPVLPFVSPSFVGGAEMKMSDLFERTFNSLQNQMNAYNKTIDSKNVNEMNKDINKMKHLEEKISEKLNNMYGILEKINQVGDFNEGTVNMDELMEIEKTYEEHIDEMHTIQKRLIEAFKYVAYGMPVVVVGDVMGEKLEESEKKYKESLSNPPFFTAREPKAKEGRRVEL